MKRVRNFNFYPLYHSIHSVLVLLIIIIISLFTDVHIHKCMVVCSAPANRATVGIQELKIFIQ